MEKDATKKRNFLKSTAALSILSLAAAGGGAQTDEALGEKLQPEEFWRERIEAPDDGKKYGWFVDTRRCFGCHGCEVSCKAENDLPLRNFIRQTIYKDVGEYPKVARMFLPMACQHCEDAPCIKACSCGTQHKESGGTVAVDYDICCGHGTCVEVCPDGVIYVDPVAKHGLKDDDWIELTSYFSAELEKQSPHLNRDDLTEANGRRVIATMRVPIVAMEGIQPRAIAMSNSCGHWQYTSVAQARREPSDTGHLVGSDGETYRDADWERNMWWEDTSVGDPAKWRAITGNGWNQNKLMPIAPDPVKGRQSFHDTVVTIKKAG